MTALRVLWKLPLALAATLGIVALPAVARIVFINRPVAWARVGAMATQCWGRTMCAILGIRREVDGGIPIGEAYVVASNHLSYIDIFVLSSLYSGNFVAKREIRSWPAFGFVAGAAGTLFVDRSVPRDLVRIRNLMVERLKAGLCLTVFPEGGNSSGATVKPFGTSILASAARAEVPCWAASLSYSTPYDFLPPSRTVCWHDGSHFIAHFVNLMTLKRIDARVRFATHPVKSSNRKELAQTLWESVASRFEPVRQVPLVTRSRRPAS